MSFITILLFLFAFLLYLYQFLVRRSMVLKAKMPLARRVTFGLIALIVLLMATQTSITLDQQIQGILASLMFANFLFDSQGFGEDGFVTNGLGNRGGPYELVQQVVLKEDPDGKGTLLRFSMGRYRSPFMLFKEPLAVIQLLVQQKVPETTEITIIE